MSSEISIRVENISKCYQIYDRPRERLKQFVMPRLQRAIGRQPKQYFREFWALNDMSFNINRGETVGIIGRNGSGKSTLLQIICGTLNPTSGSIQTHGRIAALLELGSGFNPEFSGRENVYMNAALFGLGVAEIDKKFNSIVEFSEIGDFIEQPVKTYSSGMLVRLAFAVIAHVDADILVVDEALAVGDVFFQQKCLRFLQEFRRNLGTLLFVSHDTSAVIGLCERAIFLSKGTLIQVGESQAISKLYLEQLYSDPTRHQNSLSKNFNQVKNYSVSETVKSKRRVIEADMSQETTCIVSNFRHNADRFGDGGAEIVEAGFLDQNKSPCIEINGGQPVIFFIRLAVHKDINYPAFGFMIKNNLGEFVVAEGTDAHFRNCNLFFGKGDIATAYFNFKMPYLNKGTYLINVAFAEGVGDEHIQHCWIHDAIQLEVIKTRLGNGYCGVADMTMNIEIVSDGGDE